LYNITTEEKLEREVGLQVKFDDCAWVWISFRNIFISGLGRRKSENIIVDTTTGSQTPRSYMINGRTHHASGFVNEGVYVFGGQSFRMHNESSAEVWREDLWQEIA